MTESISVVVWVYAPNRSTVLGLKTTTVFKGQSVGTAVTNAVLDGLNLDPKEKRKVYLWSSSADAPIGKALNEKTARIQQRTTLAVVLEPKKEKKKKSRR